MRKYVASIKIVVNQCEVGVHQLKVSIEYQNAIDVANTKQRFKKSPNFGYSKLGFLTINNFLNSSCLQKQFHPKLSLSDIMDLRHQSSAMCIIMLGAEGTHPWSATKVGNPIPPTIPVD